MSRKYTGLTYGVRMAGILVASTVLMPCSRAKADDTITMMQIMSNILILLQVNQHMQSLILGLIMIMATILDIKSRARLLGKID